MNPTKNIAVSFKPALTHLNEIEAWLKEEDKRSHKGFYCNWNVIQSAYQQSKMAIVLLDDNSIGFMTWHTSGQAAVIDIAEIHPRFRKQGYGKLLLAEVCNHWLTQDIFVVALECQPPASEKAWRKMGFVSYPNNDAFNYYNERDNVHLYKSLINNAEIATNIPKGQMIELWDKEHGKTAGEAPVWIWPAEFIPGTNKLVKPVIWPCFADWRIRIRAGEHIFNDGKVKYLSEDNIVHANFLILRDT